ncbi:MAG: polysaccharide biosynthesis/export family protein [Acidobacteriota bacterium]
MAITSAGGQDNLSGKTGSQTPGNSIATVVSGTPVPSAADSSDERYKIGYQDTLDIQVFRHPELNRRVSVDTNGTIQLFRLDLPITAVCKTEAELASDIAKAYEKDYLRNPEVNVVAVEQKSQSVSVIGAVEKPGSFFINRRVRLLELLAFAGGPKADEAGTRLLVARTGSRSNCQTGGMQPSDSDAVELLDFKIRDVQAGKETLWMQPGDVVSVLKADVVYMYGNVIKQGAVKISEPLTLTQAIVLAEGLKSATKTDNIRVIRTKPGTSEREEKVYDLNLIGKGKMPDPFLEPNDIVAISEDKTKSIINNIGKSLTQGIPSIFYRIP